MEVGIKEAKNDLSKLIKAAVSGEKVVITNRGKALVRLVPEALKPKHPKRGFGSLRHLLADVPAGWDSAKEKAETTALFEDLG